MEEKNSLKLGERETKILFSSGMGDLAKYLSLYGSNVFWVFDENTAKLFRILPKNSVVIVPGEKEKDFETLQQILSRAAELGLARDSRFIAFGGGVVCDMTALAASLYMRGARLTLIPTTLLAMVDASLGGKTAIDFCGVKNLVGSFYPADEVLIAVDTLKHLPEYEFRCGLGEVLKHAFITEGKDFYGYLLENRELIISRDRKTLAELVGKSLEIKTSFIESDPEDRLGQRAMLNFGHTFGHALESLDLFSISHGEGVVWGMKRAVDAGILAGITTEDVKASMDALLDAYGYDTSYRVPEDKVEEFLSFVHKDKKNIGGRIRFILLDEDGKPVLSELDDAIVGKVITE